MNMAALLIVNDFYNYTGDYFIQRIDSDVTSRDDFMQFDGYKQFLFDGTWIYQTICWLLFVIYYIIDYIFKF